MFSAECMSSILHIYLGWFGDKSATADNLASHQKKGSFLHISSIKTHACVKRPQAAHVAWSSSDLIQAGTKHGALKDRENSQHLGLWNATGHLLIGLFMFPFICF